MPGPLDFLKSAWHTANEPLVPQGAIKPMQDALDSPSLERSPFEAQLRGFGAGAMEGLRGLTSPLNLAAMAIPGGRGARGVLGAAEEAGPSLMRGAEEVGQVMPSMGDVEGLLGQMRNNLRHVPMSAEKVAQGGAEALGRGIAEFTPVGEEASYAGNAYPATKAPHRPPTGILGGLGGEAGEISPEMALIGGGAAGGLGYAGYQALKALKGGAQNVNHAVNPLQQYSDRLQQK
jgi:hypothetical protein